MQRSRGPAPVLDTQGQYALRLLRIKEGQALTFRVLSAAYGGVMTHFWRGRSCYCPGREECLPAMHRLQPQYRGYCAAELWDLATALWYPCALELSEHAELDMRGRYQRGQWWRLSRNPDVDGRPQPVVAHLVGQADLDGLPDPFDYRDVVRNVYHHAAMRFDAINPLPPRILAGPSQGQGPPAASDRDHADRVASAEEVHLLYEEYKKKQAKGGSS